VTYSPGWVSGGFDTILNGRIDSFIVRIASEDPLPADLTGNGFVDFEDLTVLLANWNQNVSAAEGNLVDAALTPVNFEDQTVLLAAWTGRCARRPPACRGA